MTCGKLQILQNPDNINIKQSPTNIQIFQGVNMVKVCAQNPVSQFLPYSFIATEDGQTVFGPLSSVPIAIITLAITGTLQDPAGNVPDYIVNGFNLILSEGVAIGNTVYGMYQVA